MDWNMFFTTFAASGVASAAFVFLAKILSKHLLSMDLERFKAELKATNEKELERLRADLRITAFQQETTFAKLHGKRAEVIAELYARLVAVHGAMQVMLYPIMHGKEEVEERHRKEAEDATAVFLEYFSAHQIYLEESLCELLRTFARNINRASLVHINILEARLDGMDTTKNIQGWQHLDSQVPPIRKEIEATFRKILGLAPSGTTPSKAD